MPPSTRVAPPTIVLAAGGNPTALFSVPTSAERATYPARARSVLRRLPGIEQVGFLEGGHHLEMSGGEFCGNATRAAALLRARATGRKTGTLTVSGYRGRVRYRVRGMWVECTFPRFPFRVRRVQVLGDITATLVDLRGIIHIVLPPMRRIPTDLARFRALHMRIRSQLGLAQASSVGVIWQQRNRGALRIFPIVWVRAVRSLFAETSCGSGTMAALIVDGAKELRILQPSGQTIVARRQGASTLTLSSRMQIGKSG